MALNVQLENQILLVQIYFLSGHETHEKLQ